MKESPPLLRFGVASDLHATDWASAETFRRALRWFRDQGVDAVMVPGDLIVITEAFGSASKQPSREERQKLRKLCLQHRSSVFLEKSLRKFKPFHRSL